LSIEAEIGEIGGSGEGRNRSVRKWLSGVDETTGERVAESEAGWLVKATQLVKACMGSRRGGLAAGREVTNMDGLSVVAVAIGMTTGSGHLVAWRGNIVG
jgi:hypothetical protein